MRCVFCNLSNVGKSEILNYSLCCPFRRFHSSHECKVPQQRSTCLSVRITATLGNRRVSQKSGAAQDKTQHAGCPGVLDPSTLLSSHECKDPSTTCVTSYNIGKWQVLVSSRTGTRQNMTGSTSSMAQCCALCSDISLLLYLPLSIITIYYHLLSTL